jgi:hypothetical protein
MAADWNRPEQQLARKILAVTGPGAAQIMFENRSSLGRRDSEIVQNGLRAALEASGIRFVDGDQAASTIKISLSESPSAYVWVAEIRQGANEAAVVMVSAPRPEGTTAVRDAVPLSLHKDLLWAQTDPILDVAVLEENIATTRLAVLDPQKVSLYRMQGGKWQQEQALEIVHLKPWPGDMRGRLIAGRDHLFDVFLPGVSCYGAGQPLVLKCRETDDPWPLLAGALNNGATTVFPSASLANGASTVVPQMKAFFASTRNFFTGVLTPGVGKLTSVPKFYSAAVLPRDRYTLWLFAATDGSTHLVDGVSDQSARLGWGSDIASVRTACGAGWQILATSSGDTANDFIRAFELPDRDPVAVSAATDFSGTVTALWTEARGDTAIAVSKNQRTNKYEAFRVAVACSQ